MVEWCFKEDYGCEGWFESTFFHDIHNYTCLTVYAENPDFIECAEKCVDSFLNMSDSNRHIVCQKLIELTKKYMRNFEDANINDDFDVLKYCWFDGLHVYMDNPDDELAYIAVGTGFWDGYYGVIVKNDEIIDLVEDYRKYLKTFNND